MRVFHSGNAFYPTIFIIVLLCVFGSTQQCHYSCANCTTPASYISCFSCSNPVNTLTVLEDTENIDSLYWHSLYSSGICTAKVPQGPNGLGIFLLIISIIGLLITQSHQAFYICSTFQTLALFGLLQVPWLQPASFLLQAFQYFMPINIILASSKIKDNNLFIYRFYRLDQYMVSIQDIGLITVFIIDCVLFLIIIILFGLTLFRRKKAAQQLELQKQQLDQNGHNLIPQFSNASQNDTQELKKQKAINKLSLTKKDKKQTLETESEAIGTEQVQPVTCRQKLGRLICQKASQCLILRKVLHIFIYVFYFFVQETCLSIMVGAVFNISTLYIAIWIVYFIEVVTVLVISIYETEVDKDLNPDCKDTHEFGLSLFLSRECLFVVLLKKVLLPLGIVIPINVQYIYFILYLVLFLVEGSVDARSGRVTCLSRMTLWKVFQMCVTTLILTYFVNERNGSTEQHSHLITIILTITLVVFIVIFFVQLAVSFVFMFLGIGKVQNAFQENSIKHQKTLQLNNTEMALNQLQKDNFNIFENIQMTRENTKTPKNAQENNQFKNKYKLRETVQVQEFNQDQNYDFPQPPRNNNQLFINKSKDNSKIKPSPDKIRPKEKDIDPKQKPQKEVQNDEEGETDEKKPKKRRILDPELRKRYGIK